jgi:sugar (glycoside-pentoside-hexuronide) transporter
VSIYLAYFYTDVFLLPPAIMGILFVVCRVWDGITDPLMGLIADTTNSRWGRFRPYLIFSPIPMVIFIGLTFTVPDMGTTAKIIWAFSTYIPLQMVKTVISIPYFSLLPLITTDAKERTELSSVMQIFAPIAFILASVFTLKLVARFPSEEAGFFYTTVIFTSLGAVAIWITAFTTRKYDYPGNELHIRRAEDETYSFKEKVMIILQNRPLIVVVGAFFCFNMLNACTMGVMIYFFKYYLEMFDHYPTLMGLFILSAIIGAAITPRLVCRVGKKKLFLIACLISAALGLTIFLLSLERDPEALHALWRPGGICFILILLVSGIGYIPPVLMGAIIPDCIDYTEWKTGLRAEGFINSFYLIANKAGMALGGAVIGVGLAFFDYEPNLPEYSERTLFGLLVLIFIVPISLRLMMFVIMLFYNISDSRFVEIVNELKIRREQPDAS